MKILTVRKKPPASQSRNIKGIILLIKALKSDSPKKRHRVLANTFTQRFKAPASRYDPSNKCNLVTSNSLIFFYLNAHFTSAAVRS